MTFHITTLSIMTFRIITNIIIIITLRITTLSIVIFCITTTSIID
jgi:hypothetical protein